MNAKELSFEQLRDNYFSGVYEHESNEELEAGVEVFFREEENDQLLKINLAAVLYLELFDEGYYSFLQSFCKGDNFELAKEAKECLSLIHEHAND
ncbi:MAG: hypothetical protein COA60_006245 [Robiginitomaculum sp.]|nr:hypothetical protein [Robiginitomaculum sp.]